MNTKNKVSRKKKKQAKKKRQLTQKEKIINSVSLAERKLERYSTNNILPKEEDTSDTDDIFCTAEKLTPDEACEKIARHWHIFLVSIFFVVTACIIYSNTLHVPFVFDDFINISGNSSIRISKLNIENLSKAALENPIASRPLAYISFALNYYLYQYELPGYHAFNIFLHALNSIVLYMLFVGTFETPAIKKKVNKPLIIALAASVIWLVHPLQTQTVTYIVQRMNSMATLFYLLAMLFYVWARLSSGRLFNRILLFSGCFISALLGFLSKEILVTLPFFILLYEFYFFQDLDVSWLKSKVFIIIAFILSATILIVINHEITSVLSGYANRPFTLSERLLTESRVIIFYISQLFLPHPSRLNLHHEFPISVSVTEPLTTLFSVAALLSLLIIAIVIAKRWRIISYGILWYLGNLILESSVIPLEIIFEHRNYLPSTFVCLVLVYIFLNSMNGFRFKLAQIVLLLIALTFSYWTYDRNNVWQNKVDQRRL